MTDRRAAASFLLTALGALSANAALGAGEWAWGLLVLVGVAAGSVAGRPGRVWLALAGVLAGEAAASWLGVGALPGPFWYLLLAARLFVIGLAFVVGTSVGWRRQGLARGWRRAVVGLVVAAAIGLAGYTIAVGVLFSGDYVVQAGEGDCRTPMLRFGWAYEAINYDIADDERLSERNPDLLNCSSQGSLAGSAVVSADGTPIAGWYIAAASADIGPTGPTLVLVHGGKDNKSGMLKYAVPFHDDYNLVLIDLRNQGRSGGDVSTGGLQERYDLRAMIDWLERTKHPGWIGLVGNSNGAQTGLAEAIDDPRIRALVLDSMQASIITQLGNVAETEKSLPAWPGAWAVITGASLRVGGDISSLDPVRTIGLIGSRPILLLHGGNDIVDRPRDSLARNVAAALAAGVAVEFHVCAAASHGQVIDTCPDAWSLWARSFLDLAREGS